MRISAHNSSSSAPVSQALAGATFTPQPHALNHTPYSTTPIECQSPHSSALPPSNARSLAEQPHRRRASSFLNQRRCQLGIGICLNGTDGVLMHGCVVLQSTDGPDLSYGAQGHSFHHCCVVQNLHSNVLEVNHNGHDRMSSLSACSA